MCQTNKPNGVVCRICDQRLPFEEAICVKGDHGYHRRCLAPEFAYSDLSCSHCDRSLTTKHVSFDTILARTKPDCPHCGNLDVLRIKGTCDCCDLPISEALGQTNAAPIASMGQAHTFCRTKPHPRARLANALVNLPNVLVITLGAAAFYYLAIVMGL